VKWTPDGIRIEQMRLILADRSVPICRICLIRVLFAPFCFHFKKLNRSIECGSLDAANLKSQSPNQEEEL
jgi:hypothetical protein